MHIDLNSKSHFTNLTSLAHLMIQNSDHKNNILFYGHHNYNAFFT